MGFRYIEENTNETFNVAITELKNSVGYLCQSIVGKDNLESLLSRLGEYTDSIIVQRTEEGKRFRDGICTLSLNNDNDSIDVLLQFTFENVDHMMESHKLKNNIEGAALTDEAFETVKSKRTMKFEIIR